MIDIVVECYIFVSSFEWELIILLSYHNSTIHYYYWYAEKQPIIEEIDSKNYTTTASLYICLHSTSLKLSKCVHGLSIATVNL